MSGIRGRLDFLSRQRVAGWACHSDDFASRAEVVVKADGVELGRVCADLPRPDLLATGKFGDGHHGFVFDFDPELSDRREYMVEVCIVRGKETNTFASHVLRSSPSTHEARAVLSSTELGQAPTLRRTFELFAGYNAQEGIRSLDASDRKAWSMDEVFLSTLGRTPNAIIASENSRPNNELFYENLKSDEFQRNVRLLLIGAFPEIKRDIFVHIPKCAGTDLSENLKISRTRLNQSLETRLWFRNETLFEALRDINVDLKSKRTFLLDGHQKLLWIERNRVARQEDALFSVIRDPVEIFLSGLNYVVTRLLSDKNLESVDTRGWAHQLNLSVPHALSPKMLAAVIIERKPQIAGVSALCDFLGDGTAAGSLAILRQSKIEITDTYRYKRWLSARWNIESNTRHNSGSRVLGETSFDSGLVSQVEHLLYEDRLLYNHIISSLESKNAISVRGYEL